MLFNSAIFIFGFLPFSLALFWGLKASRYHHLAFYALLGLSLFFYGYWSPPHLVLLLISIGVNCTFAHFLQAWRDVHRKRTKIVFIAGMLFNLSLLGYFKYAGFSIEIFNSVTGDQLTVPDIVLPLGISFFTFQQISFLYDIYRGDFKLHRLRDYALSVSFFPHLIAGPIVIAKKIIPQFENHRQTRFWNETSFIGLCLFIMGLFKKTVIADHLATYANPLFAMAEQGMTLGFVNSWLAALTYSFQLYFDFSGYSDMAVGLALMFGIFLSFNFLSPYKTLNISEFWRRWHMSMSNYFRDVVFIPLGGSRVGVPRHILNLMITMAIVGLWHGAGWSFIIWGFYHGILLSVHALYRVGMTSVFQTLPSGTIYKASSFALTFLVVVVGWVIFRAGTLEASTGILHSMAGLDGIALPQYLAGMLAHLPAQGFFHSVEGNEVWLSVSPWSAVWVILSFLTVLLFPCSLEIFGLHSEGDDKRQGSIVRAGSSWRFKRMLMHMLLIAAMAVMALLSLQRISEFLYFQF